jgi:beta-N-acetylhexosaminidase
VSTARWATTDPLAGLVLAGFDGSSADEAGPRALLELGVGGFVLFARNIESPGQVHELLAGLRTARGERPTLYAVDQEGGRVQRIREPATRWPPMAQLGRLADGMLARQVGEAIGREIQALGFNVDFAPVLDVLCEDTTVAIGDRSLSADPDVVGRLGSALMGGLHLSGVMATMKHFPGHGQVRADSHVELPVCPASLDELRARHLRPFWEAARAGAFSVMSAHVLYPALDAERPATLSPRWLKDVLRQELGFTGLVFSDDLEMGAIVGQSGIGAAAVAAIRAGVDGLLICHSLERVREAVAALRAEAERDPEFLASCKQSLARMERAAAFFPPRPAPRGALLERLGTKEHRALAERMGGEAVLAEGGRDPTAAVPGRLS